MNEKLITAELSESDQPPAFWSPQMIFAQKVLIAGGVITALVLTLAVLWAGADIFLLVFAGFLLAVFLRSLGGFLSKYTPLSDGWALVVVLVFLVAVIALGAWLLAPSVERQFEELSDQLPVVYENARWQLAQYPIGRKIIERVPSAQQLIMGGESVSLFGRVTGFFSTALNIITNLLIVLMIALYLAFSPSHYNEGIVKLVPKKREKRAREILQMIDITLGRFLAGISVSMIINGTLTISGLWFLGVPFAIPLGIIAGLLTFIPNIGPFIAAAPAILIALSQSPRQAVYVLVCISPCRISTVLSSRR